jgi:hypothetical protein
MESGRFPIENIVHALSTRRDIALASGYVLGVPSIHQKHLQTMLFEHLKYCIQYTLVDCRATLRTPFSISQAPSPADPR